MTVLMRLASLVPVLLLACATAAAAGQNPSRPLAMQIVEFSWPLQTGAVVPQGATAVTLDRGMGFQMRFRLPADCTTLANAVARYGSDESEAFRTQYSRAQDFCGRARVFTLGAPTAARDFVSRYNFTALPLDAVPYEVRCQATASAEMMDLCGRIRARDNSACATGTLPAQVSAARFLVQVDAATKRATLDCRPLRVDPVSCRLTRAQFAGTLTVRSGQVRCSPLASAAGGTLELQDVSFRDINRDGLMDALLSVSEVGTGSTGSGSWFTFALTRRSATAALERLPLE